MSDKIIQSYVFHNDKRYFVSTIERDSSAIEYPHRYNETIVWEWEEGKKERGELLIQDEDIKGSIKKHLEICSEIYKQGIVRS
jgi:hypothetical protein